MHLPVALSLVREILEPVTPPLGRARLPRLIVPARPRERRTRPLAELIGLLSAGTPLLGRAALPLTLGLLMLIAKRTIAMSLGLIVGAAPPLATEAVLIRLRDPPTTTPIRRDPLVRPAKKASSAPSAAGEPRKVPPTTALRASWAVRRPIHREYSCHCEFPRLPLCLGSRGTT